MRHLCSDRSPQYRNDGGRLVNIQWYPFLLLSWVLLLRLRETISTKAISHISRTYGYVGLACPLHRTFELTAFQFFIADTLFVTVGVTALLEFYMKLEPSANLDRALSNFLYLS